MSWQPIETAPKDGTRILVRGNDYRCPTVFSAMYEDGNWWMDCWGSDEKIFPEHWLPCPELPT